MYLYKHVSVHRQHRCEAAVDHTGTNLTPVILLFSEYNPFIVLPMQALIKKNEINSIRNVLK